MPVATYPLIRVAGPTPELQEDIRKRSGTDPFACLQCGACASGCPFYEAMDLTPRAVMRCLSAGLLEKALLSETIWTCVGCHTCSSACPMSIDIAAVMDALRSLALEKGVAVAEPDVLAFHRDVLASIRRHGRTHKVEIMARHKLRKRDFFSDVNKGLRMLAKGKLHLFASKVEDHGAVERLFATESEGACPES